MNYCKNPKKCTNRYLKGFFQAHSYSVPSVRTATGGTHQEESKTDNHQACELDIKQGYI